MDHDAVLADVLAWAAGEPNVRVVTIEGSVGRGERVDRWSDLDLRLYVVDPEPLLATSEWYEAFGEVLVVEALANDGWYPSRLVYYVDGKVDFVIAPVESLAGKQRFGTLVRVLLDEDGLTEGIAQGPTPAVPLPDEAAYRTAVNHFYAAALMAARMLVRDEPLKAHVRDTDAKRRLFQMIGWDHRARYGDERDVHPQGSRFHEWADPDVVEALAACWATIDPADGLRALDATVALYQRLADRVAAATGLEPFDPTAVCAELRRIAADRPA